MRNQLAMRGPRVHSTVTDTEADNDAGHSRLKTGSPRTDYQANPNANI